MNWVYSDEIKTNPKKIIELLLLFEIKNISKHKLSQDLKQLLNNEKSMDFKLLIPDLENNDDEDEGKSFEEIPVHKFILSARSGLFREMFQKVEKTENQVQDYSGKSMETMELLINYFYTGNFDLTADNDINFISEELQDVQDYYQLNPNSSFYTKFQQLTKDLINVFFFIVSLLLSKHLFGQTHQLRFNLKEFENICFYSLIFLH